MSSPGNSSDADIAAVNRHRKADLNLFRTDASSSPPPPLPSIKRRPQPRFLGDDDEEDIFGAAQDLFADLEDVGNAPVRGGGEYDFDDLDNNNNADVGGDVDKPLWNEDEGQGVDGVAEKKKRIVARMDDVRLTGPSGFAKLQETVSSFKVRGKGSEIQDLKRVMVMYQLWAHQMYPKTNLRDTLQTIEKLGHKRSVQRAVRELREHSRPSRPRGEEEVPRAETYPPASPKRDVGEKRTVVEEDRAMDVEASFDDLFGDEDEEAMMLAELEAAEQTQKARPTRSNSAPMVGEGAVVVAEEQEDDEEGEEMLRQMEFDG